MKKINLLELCLSPDLGGLELYMFRCSEALSDRMNVISVINAKGKLLSYFENSVNTYLPFKKKSNLHIFIEAKKLAAIIDQHNIDIIHIHWTNDIPIAVLAKKFSNRNPFLAQTRHMMMTRFKSDIYHRFLYRHINLLLPVTYQVGEQLNTFIPEAIRPIIKVLYLGCDIPALLSDDQLKEYKRSLGIENNFTIGLVGRINEAKGQWLLIEAVELLVKARYSVKAFIVGNAKNKQYLESLHQMIIDRGLEANIEFLGFLKNPQHFMQICDVIVMASQNETFGLVSIEAMQVGVPVIGSDRGGVLEIIDDYKTGLLFKSQNAQDLFEKITLMYNDPALKKRLGNAGLKKAREQFSSKQQFDKLAEVFIAMYNGNSTIR